MGASSHGPAAQAGLGSGSTPSTSAPVPSSATTPSTSSGAPSSSRPGPQAASTSAKLHPSHHRVVVVMHPESPKIDWQINFQRKALSPRRDAARDAARQVAAWGKSDYGERLS